MHTVHLHGPSMRELRHLLAGLKHLAGGRAGEVIFSVAVVLLILIAISSCNRTPGR
jgi:hypothetical protein